MAFFKGEEISTSKKIIKCLNYYNYTFFDKVVMCYDVWKRHYTHLFSADLKYLKCKISKVDKSFLHQSNLPRRSQYVNVWRRGRRDKIKELLPFTFATAWLLSRFLSSSLKVGLFKPIIHFLNYMNVLAFYIRAIFFCINYECHPQVY